MPKPRINYALAATLLASGMTCDEIAPKVGAKNAESLNQGLFKRGVTAKFARSLPPTGLKTAALVRQVVTQSLPELKRQLKEQSESVRNALAQELVSQSQLLTRDLPTHARELGNTPDRQGRAAIAKTVAETASKVFGWEEEERRTEESAMLFFEIDSDTVNDKGNGPQEPAPAKLV